MAASDSPLSASVARSADRKAAPRYLALNAMRGWRRGAFPLVVVGANSIFIYMFWQLLNGWISKTLTVFTGGFSWFGAAAPALQQCAVSVILWAVCYWLYRRSIFFKL